MGSENVGPILKSDTQQPYPVVPPVSPPSVEGETAVEPAYREHVSQPLYPYPMQHAQPPYPPYAPHQQYGQGYGPPQPQPQPMQPYGQGHQSYPPQQPYSQGYAPNQQQPFPPSPHYGAYYPTPYYNGYYGYGPYYDPRYQYYQPQPKRDGYSLAIAIASFCGSILAILGGLGSLAFLLLFSLANTSSSGIKASQAFGAVVLFTVFSIAGTVGGSFGFYHSFRALFLRKPSIPFKLPRFWIFLALYVALIVVGFLLRDNSQAFANEPLTISLILLAGVLPALMFLSLAVRRLRSPDGKTWPTTWRRFTLALLSGATAAIVLAAILEFILTLFVTAALRVNSFDLSNPDVAIPHDPRVIIYYLLVVSVIAPLIEESVKPLAVVSFIGRMNSAAEAFVLGMSCGIGFDLIETSGYISQGYHNWLDVALQRSTAGCLHGLGAGMVALGWYYLTHKGSARHRILLGVGCGLYAVTQHAIWNGAFLFMLLPAPIGPYLEKGVINIGSYPLQAFVLVYIVESLLMLLFFLYVTGKLRKAGQTPTTKPSSATNEKEPVLQTQGVRHA